MTNIFLISLAAISIAIIIFYLLKKKSQSRHKSEYQNTTNNPNYTNKLDQEKDHKEASKSNKNEKGVRPEGNQQRDLNREVGGLEESEKKALDTVDPWENRSEEIDKEGAIDQLGSSGKKSMIWKNKKHKLDIADAIEDGVAAHEISKMEKNAGLDKDPKGKFSKMIRFRENSHDGHGSQGGGISL